MLWLSLALAACNAPEPAPAVYRGPSVTLRQKVGKQGVTLELLAGGKKPRWKVAAEAITGGVEFRDDGQYLATGSVRVFGPDGREQRFDPSTQLTEDEKKQLRAEEPCAAPAWLGGLRWRGKELAVAVRGLKSQPGAPALELLIDVEAGTLRRSAPAAAPEPVEALLAAYTQSPDRRAELLDALTRKVGPAADAAALRAFARQELPTATTREAQGQLLGILDGAGNLEDRIWVGREAARQKWPPEAVFPVLEHASGVEVGLTAYGRAVFAQSDKPEARAAAVRVLAHTAEWKTYLPLAIGDPQPLVQAAAEEALATAPLEEETFTMLATRVDRAGPRALMVTRFLDLGPSPWPARFEHACETGFKGLWPGCEAFSGALADLRNDKALAKQRYRRALPAVTADLDTAQTRDEPTWLRLHVRLAQLAKEARDNAELKVHLAALKGSARLRALGLECQSCLPKQLDAQCKALDGKAATELLAQLASRRRIKGR